MLQIILIYLTNFLFYFLEKEFKVNTFTVVADFSNQDKEIYDHIAQQISDKEIGILSNFFLLYNLIFDSLFIKIFNCIQSISFKRVL